MDLLPLMLSLELVAEAAVEHLDQAAVVVVWVKVPLQLTHKTPLELQVQLEVQEVAQEVHRLQFSRKLVQV